MLKVCVPRYQLDDQLLLESIDTSFEQGSFTVILGPNGAGKSTLMSVLAGVASHKPNQKPKRQWDVLLGGRSIYSLSPREKAKKLVMLTQHNPLDFAFSVTDVVKMGAYPLALSPDQEAVALEKVLYQCDLSDLEDRSYLKLSGGERQRVHMARALMQVGESTQLLLLDEPLSALDLRHQHASLDYFRQLAEDGMCVVAVLHDAELAARYAHRLLFLKHGRVVSHGDCAALWRSDRLTQLYDLPIEASYLHGIPRLLAKI